MRWGKLLDVVLLTVEKRSITINFEFENLMLRLKTDVNKAKKGVQFPGQTPPLYTHISCPRYCTTIVI